MAAQVPADSQKLVLPLMEVVVLEVVCLLEAAAEAGKHRQSGSMGCSGWAYKQAIS